MVLDITLYLIASVVFIQFFYHIFFHTRFLFYKSKASLDYDSQKPISIIIAARNELENLKVLLPLLQKQNYPKFEIIIVDDRSIDGSYEFLYDERNKDTRIKIVRIDHTPDHISNKKYAITLGVKAAQYEHLLFTDADCYPESSNWVAWMTTEFVESKDFVLGVSPYQKQKGILNWIIQHETFTTAIQYLSYAFAKIPYMGVGRNLAYRKHIFIENKGFNDHLKIVGGDDDLFVNQHSNSQNTTICIQKEAHIFSYPKTTWKSWLGQKNRHLSVGKFYKKKHLFLLGLQNLTHVLFWILLPISVLVSFLYISDFQLKHYILISFAGLRIFSWSCLHFFASKKIKFQSSWLSWWLFDCVYVFFIIILGIKAFFSKPERWT
ncbi:MAG: glycosyltransferase [Raineya sp.]|jgi:glycosyltransferase involved in cell wall biosynthesis|nr:glycosyltransferase [Raineya sp.]